MTRRADGPARPKASELSAEPEDARRGLVAPLPRDVDEATADREMADAERQVVQGTASETQRALVAALEGARTQEERRARHAGHRGR